MGMWSIVKEAGRSKGTLRDLDSNVEVRKDMRPPTKYCPVSPPSVPPRQDKRLPWLGVIGGPPLSQSEELQIRTRLASTLIGG